MRLNLSVSNTQICLGRAALALSVVLYAAVSVLIGPHAARGAEPTDDSLHVSGDGLSHFLGKWCADCHGPDTQESGLRFDTLSQEWDDPKIAAQ